MRFLMFLLLLAAPLAGQRVDADDGYSFEPPAGMQEFGGSLPLSGFEPQYLYAGRIVPGDPAQVLLAIGLLATTPGFGELPEFPADANASMIREHWNNEPVYGFRTLATDQRVALWIDVPLRQGALRVCMVCPPNTESRVRPLLARLVADIDGTPADRASGSATSAGADSGNLAAWLLLVGLLVLVAVLGYKLLVRPSGAAVPLPTAVAEPLPLPEPVPMPAEAPPAPPSPTKTVQPPWAVTRDAPGPATGGEIPPWEHKPKPPVP